MNWSSLQIAEKLYLNWLHYLSLFSPGESRTTSPCSVLEIYCRRFGRSSKSFWKSLPKLEVASQPISDGLWIVSVFCILSNPDFSCLVFSLGNLVSANVSYYNCSIWNYIQRCENLSCLVELSSKPLELHLLFCRLRTFREWECWC